MEKMGVETQHSKTSSVTYIINHIEPCKNSSRVLTCSVVKVYVNAKINVFYLERDRKFAYGSDCQKECSL